MTPPSPAVRVRTPTPARVLVVGGGLAGLTAALALADRGVAVTLAEARPRLGGLACSFRRATDVGELTVDTGHHVHLRCCTAYRALLDRLGATHLAPCQRRLDVPVLDATTRRLGHLRRVPLLPAPLHLAPSLARYPHLTPRERLSVARAAVALRRLNPADPALDERNLADWLRHQRQGDRCVAALWDLLGLAMLNAHAADASLQLAVTALRTGLLATPRAADLAVPVVPLGELHDTRARAALAAAGVRVVTATRVRRLRRAPDAAGETWRATLATRGGQHELTADAVILATPPPEAHRLLPPGALAAPDTLRLIDTAPIVNLHVIYDRPVSPHSLVAVLGSVVQWLFDRTAAAGLRGGGQYLVVSQSAAHEEIAHPVGALRDRFLPELARLLPAAAHARVRDFFVTRERAATFAPTPGVGRLRPGPVTRAPGLYLAGAWTATGWPATMEGAVRSGLAAAHAATTHRTTLKERT